MTNIICMQCINSVLFVNFKIYTYIHCEYITKIVWGGGGNGPPSNPLKGGGGGGKIECLFDKIDKLN